MCIVYPFNAQEALSELPKNAKAICLVGRVLSQLPEGREKAKRAYQKALAIDPLSIDAAVALSELLIGGGEYSACVELLRTSLDQTGHHDFLWTKLGEVRAKQRAVLWIHGYIHPPYAHIHTH